MIAITTIILALALQSIAIPLHTPRSAAPDTVAVASTDAPSTLGTITIAPEGSGVELTTGDAAAPDSTSGPTQLFTDAGDGDDVDCGDDDEENLPWCTDADDVTDDVVSESDSANANASPEPTIAARQDDGDDSTDPTDADPSTPSVSGPSAFGFGIPSSDDDSSDDPYSDGDSSSSSSSSSGPSAFGHTVPSDDDDSTPTDDDDSQTGTSASGPSAFGYTVSSDDDSSSPADGSTGDDDSQSASGPSAFGNVVGSGDDGSDDTDSDDVDATVARRHDSDAEFFDAEDSIGDDLDDTTDFDPTTSDQFGYTSYAGSQDQDEAEDDAAAVVRSE